MVMLQALAQNRKLHVEHCQGFTSHVYNLRMAQNRIRLVLKHCNISINRHRRSHKRDVGLIFTLLARALLSNESSLAKTLLNKTKSVAMNRLEELKMPRGYKRGGVSV